MNSTTEPRRVHEGRNVKRIREILGIKQDALAIELGLSQQAISNIEQRETIEPDVLQEIAGILKVPVEAIKNFDEKTAINIVADTVNNHDQSASVFYNPVFNPIDKWFEALEENKRLSEENKSLYERLLQSEKEKVEMLEQLLKIK